MNLTHQQKIKKAKKMLSNKEKKGFGVGKRKIRTPLFQSKQWTKQTEDRRAKELRKLSVKK